MEFRVMTVSCISISLFIKTICVVQDLSPTVVTVFTIMVTFLSYIRDYTYTFSQCPARPQNGMLVLYRIENRIFLSSRWTQKWCPLAHHVTGLFVFYRDNF